jgi:hypothetical protein
MARSRQTRLCYLLDGLVCSRSVGDHKSPPALKQRPCSCMLIERKRADRKLFVTKRLMRRTLILRKGMHRLLFQLIRGLCCLSPMLRLFSSLSCVFISAFLSMCKEARVASYVKAWWCKGGYICLRIFVLLSTQFAPEQVVCNSRDGFVVSSSALDVCGVGYQY